ncbi:MAG: hypothetical protein JWQ68_1209 [Cryobacterium sp.]|jgi:hypothetical protein|nr:hypothetical protein [Cryobacterium sp.]
MTVRGAACAVWPGQAPDWTFVMGARFLAAVPVSASPRVVARLHDIATDADADVELIVSLLPLAGEDAVETFAIVMLSEAAIEGEGDTGDGDLGDAGISVTAVVRGDIAVDMVSVGGSRRFTAAGIRPWLLAEFRSVVGVVIGSPEHAPVARGNRLATHPLGTGTALGATLHWWLIAGAPASVGHAADKGDSDDTVLRIREMASPVADTILRRRRTAEDTVILRHRPRRDGDQGDDGRNDVLQDASPPSRSHYGFRLPGGEEHRLDGVYYLGRRPRAPRLSGGSPPRLVSVGSRTSAVSGTHLEIRQEGDSVVVTDLGSTNGTVINPPRGGIQRLRPGQSLTVVPGATVDIGDGNIIEILPVGGG